MSAINNETLDCMFADGLSERGSRAYAGLRPIKSSALQFFYAAQLPLFNPAEKSTAWHNVREIRIDLRSTCDLLRQCNKRIENNRAYLLRDSGYVWHYACALLKVQQI